MQVFRKIANAIESSKLIQTQGSSLHKNMKFYALAGVSEDQDIISDVYEVQDDQTPIERLSKPFWFGIRLPASSMPNIKENALQNLIF